RNPRRRLLRPSRPRRAPFARSARSSCRRDSAPFLTSFDARASAALGGASRICHIGGARKAPRRSAPTMTAAEALVADAGRDFIRDIIAADVAAKSVTPGDKGFSPAPHADLP